MSDFHLKYSAALSRIETLETELAEARTESKILRKEVNALLLHGTECEAELAEAQAEIERLGNLFSDSEDGYAELESTYIATCKEVETYKAKYEAERERLDWLLDKLDNLSRAMYVSDELDFTTGWTRAAIDAAKEGG